jgi:hypothetical protein
LDGETRLVISTFLPLLADLKISFKTDLLNGWVGQSSVAAFGSYGLYRWKICEDIFCLYVALMQCLE